MSCFTRLSKIHHPLCLIFLLSMSNKWDITEIFGVLTTAPAHKIWRKKTLRWDWKHCCFIATISADAVCPYLHPFCSERWMEWVDAGWRKAEEGRVEGGASLKSGFQLNPWLSSKRRRKMTEVHDMARSPRPAKPFHFSPFVSLQLLIFMITQPSCSPRHTTRTHTHSHPLRNKKTYTDRTLNQNPEGFLSFAFPKPDNTENPKKHVLYRMKNRWIISQANLE